MSSRGRALLLASLTIVAVPACGEESPSRDAARTQLQSPPAEPSDPPTPGFRDKSGVTDIPAFGVEGSAAEGADARRALVAYLRAYRAEDWKTGCSYLAGVARAQLLELISKVPGVPKTCEEALRLTAEALPPPYAGSIERVALRLKRGGAAGEGAGFALFHGEDGRDYWITARLEGGEWRIGASVPRPL